MFLLASCVYNVPMNTTHTISVPNPDDLFAPRWAVFDGFNVKVLGPVENSPLLNVRLNLFGRVKDFVVHPDHLIEIEGR